MGLALAACLPAAAHELGTIQVEASFRRDATWEVAVAIDETHLTGAGASGASASSAAPGSPATSPAPTSAGNPASVSPGGTPPIEGLTPDLAVRLGPFVRSLAAGASPAFDGRPARPARISIAEPAPSDDPFAPTPRPTLHLSGPIPPGARAFTWSQALPVGSYPLALLNDGDAAPSRQWLKDTGASAPFLLAAHVVPPDRGVIIRQYLALGFTHILPLGLDHILFVLGLFLLSARWKPLLAQISAFTAAHTLTLALTVYGVVSLPARVVEPLIALSIVYVAVENVLAPALKPWRVALVFGFGLLHGMGFAGVLRELGLPRSEFLTGVLSFNAGVEAGQLTVVALAFLALRLPWGAAPWYRRRIAVPASLAIAATGLWWSIERIFL